VDGLPIQDRSFSGGVQVVPRNHVTGQSQKFLFGDRAGAKAHFIAGIIMCILEATSQHENGQLRHAPKKLGNEVGAADARHVVAGDHKGQFRGEAGLLDQAKGFCGVADSANVLELLFQDGLAQKCL